MVKKANIKIIYTPKEQISDSIFIEIVSFNEKKFRLSYDVHNGGSYANVDVMTVNGDWAKIADKYILGVSLVSYVSNRYEFKNNWNDVKKVMYDFIEKLYGDK